MEEYRYCPACGGQFEAYLDYCPHCATPLVDEDDLPGLRVIEGEVGQNEVVVHITADLGEAEHIALLLGQEGIPVQVYSIDTKAAGLTFTSRTLLHIAVPAAMEEKVVFLLQMRSSIPTGDKGPSPDQADKKRRLEAAIQAEEEGLAALEEFFAESDDLRQQAMDAALEFVEGVDLLVNWVARACLGQELAHGLMRAVGEACIMLGEEEPEQAVAGLAPGLQSPDAWVRKNFCFALGKLGADPAVPYLVSALRDPSPEVRNEAIDQLHFLEGTSLGYEPDLEPEEQLEALEKWQKLASRIERRM
jgi:hypothetical protein